MSKEQVIALFKELEQFLKSKDFEEDLRQVLEKAYPNYLKVLEKRRKDMDKTDNAVVIAGMVIFIKRKMSKSIFAVVLFVDTPLPRTHTHTHTHAHTHKHTHIYMYIMNGKNTK